MFEPRRTQRPVFRHAFGLGIPIIVDTTRRLLSAHWCKNRAILPANDGEIMTSITTAFTERFGLTHAFAQAGMAFAGEKPELTIAVSKAGGIGAIGVGFMPPEELRATIRTIRAAGVTVVSFHWGHPSAEQVALLKAAGCSIWVQVGSVADAETAIGYGAEVIIAQGHEAGGHNYQGVGGAEQPGMGGIALIPVMADAIAGRALLLAAGGIADGRGVAAALALGADGVWVGTRLVASAEAYVHPEHHRRLVEAEGTDTTLSGVFGPEMPFFNPMRLHKSRVVKEWTHRLAEVPTVRDDLEVIGETVFLGGKHIKRKFDVILPTEVTTGDFEEMAWLMGQGVGLVKDIRPAAEIVATMMAEAATVLKEKAARIK
jgi:NAD(P)H-dependent flavin oxidoreductase YrpB (nitropropane dioxygenase family)